MTLIVIVMATDMAQSVFVKKYFQNMYMGGNRNLLENYMDADLQGTFVKHQSLELFR